MKRRIIETDVLVAGGGGAGFRAANGAREKGVGLPCQTPAKGDVTLDPVREDRVLKHLVTVRSKPLEEK